MIKATTGLFFAFAWLALGAPLVNAQSEMEKSKKQVCLEKCSETRMAECNGGVRFDPFASHEKKAQAVKNCEKQLSACRGKCGSYEGTRVIRR